MSSESTYSLLELMREVKLSLNSKFSTPIWIVAEINNLTEHRNGHCYLELIQKANNTDNIIAQTRAVIWSSQYLYVKKYFEGVTKKNLQRGIKVLVKISIDFHELYGFSLNITDIDPNYTLGDLEKRKQEIIEQLKEAGVFEMNKMLDIPSIIQKIAIISSETAAGYEDFTNHLKKNNYNYQFNYTLFQSDLQGNNTEKSILNSLNNIFEKIENFDVIVIIRGGGSKTDLSYFDNFNIAFAVAQVPIPILSGIGHDRDESVTDMVANKNFKTPTAVADFIIENNRIFENYIENTYEEIISTARNLLKKEELKLSNFGFKILKIRELFAEYLKNNDRKYNKLVSILNQKLNSEKNKLGKINYSLKFSINDNFQNQNLKILNIQTKLKRGMGDFLNNNFQKLKNTEQKINLIDPKNVLKRGYTITKLNGKSIKENDLVEINDEIETITYNKILKSKIIQLKDKDTDKK
ncbi:MAG: exodeoxyribonuclease VII large subunit [Bacteroidales bacterium]|jgi:exodeoxyribonuclease VII large subunit|nr:exodeoxyribonuclease VII large subunit [Bacteroidales bacterium]